MAWAECLLQSMRPDLVSIGLGMIFGRWWRSDSLLVVGESRLRRSSCPARTEVFRASASVFRTLGEGDLISSALPGASVSALERAIVFVPGSDSDATCCCPMTTEAPVPGKTRVLELAKELNVPISEVVARLAELGEYGKTTASTIEPSAAQRLRELYSGGGHRPRGTSPRRPVRSDNPFGVGTPPSPGAGSGARGPRSAMPGYPRRPRRPRREWYRGTRRATWRRSCSTNG